MGMVRVAIFRKIWDQSVLGTLVNSKFWRKRMIPYISFGVLTRFSGTVYQLEKVIACFYSSG